MQAVALAAKLNVLVLEPRSDAASRTECFDTLGTLPKAGTALALQCDVAFGLALRAWHTGPINFLPHRQNKQQALRRAWLLGVAVCAMGGAFLAAGFALVISSAADHKYPPTDAIAASGRAYNDAQKAHIQAKEIQQRSAEQRRWLDVRKALQVQSLQWSRVLSQAAQGVWVSSVKQQGTRWTVQGEALSASHAQQLVQQLKVLDIWAQAPELPQLQVMPAVSTTGLPVWQFRIEADLKVGA
jgi:type IV pilus assembly protein PilN